MPVAVRTGWVSPQEPLTLTRQCALTGVMRSTLYAPRPAATPDEQELILLGLIDAEYTRHPFYGSRKIRQYLRGVGHPINRKRVQRLMGVLGLAGMAPGPNTSRPHPQHTVYPYLLRGVVVTRPNQVWSTDITYIRFARGFVYLVAVIDWYSRKVLAWRYRIPWITGSAWRVWRTPCDLRYPRNLQHRSGLPVHLSGVHRGAHGARHRHQHGWARAGLGQHLRGAALAERQVRRHLSERVRHAAGIADGTDGILRVLQHRTTTSVVGLRDTGRSLPDREWRRSTDCGSIR